MGKGQKFYVVWQGNNPGIYDNWPDCLLQVKAYPGAKYKSFASKKEADEAYGSSWNESKKSISKIGLKDWRDIVPQGSITVDAACSGNPGDLEYRGVDPYTGIEMFHQGPFKNGTNNIGEFLALVHALAMLQKEKKSTASIFTDSKTAISWVKRKHANTKLEFNASNQKLKELILRAESWLKTNTFNNSIVKWETDIWGEIPADFGRK